jgi:hypothetical protein
VLLVELLQNAQTMMLQSVDVGRHGLFVTHPSPPRERHVVMLNIHLPDGAIRATAMVSRVVDRPNGQGGMGVQFFALAEDQKARWDRFIAELDGQRQVEPLGPTRSDVASFYVKPRHLDRLKAFYAENVLNGRMELATPVLKAVGNDVNMVVVHPLTQEEFTLRGVVTAVHVDRPKRMEIVFSEMSADLVTNFAGFVETGVRAATLPPMPPPGPELAEGAPRRGHAPPPLPQDAHPPVSVARPPLFGLQGHDEELVVEDDQLFEWESVELDEEAPPPAESIPVVHGQLLQSTPAPLEVEVPPPTSPALAAPSGVSGRDALAILYSVAEQLRRDNMKARVRCKHCNMPEAHLEVGSPPGVMAMFSQMRPHWCPHCRKVVTGLRVDPNGGRQRLLDLLGTDMLPLMMAHVPLSFVFDALALAQPPRCTWCGGNILVTHATNMLDERLWWLHEGDTQELTGAGGDCCPDALWVVHRVKTQVVPPAPAATPTPTTSGRMPNLEAFMQELVDTQAAGAAELRVDDATLPAPEAPPPDASTAVDGMQDGFLVFSNAPKRVP